MADTKQELSAQREKSWQQAQQLTELHAQLERLQQQVQQRAQHCDTLAQQYKEADGKRLLLEQVAILVERNLNLISNVIITL